MEGVSQGVLGIRVYEGRREVQLLTMGFKRCAECTYLANTRLTGRNSHRSDIPQQRHLHLNPQSRQTQDDRVLQGNAPMISTAGLILWGKQYV